MLDRKGKLGLQFPLSLAKLASHLYHAGTLFC